MLAWFYDVKNLTIFAQIGNFNIQNIEAVARVSIPLLCKPVYLLFFPTLIFIISCWIVFQRCCELYFCLWQILLKISFVKNHFIYIERFKRVFISSDKYCDQLCLKVSLHLTSKEPVNVTTCKMVMKTLMVSE